MAGAHEAGAVVGERRPRRAALIALLGYLAVAMAYWAPMLLRPEEQWSAGRDYHQNLWNLWWLRHAWENALPMLRSDWLFHPSGTSLGFHTTSLATTVPGVALQDFGGPETAYTVLFLAAFPLTAMGMWVLARHLSASLWGAFLAGLIFAFNPYHTAMITQLNNVVFAFAPLFLWAVLRLRETGRWHWAAWGVLFLAAAGYVDWYQPVLLGLGALVVLGAMAWHEKAWPTRRLGLQLVAVGAGALVLALPGLLPMIHDIRAGYGDEQAVGIRLVGQFQFFGTQAQNSGVFHFYPVMTGWLASAFALFGLVRSRDRRITPWKWLFVVAFVLLQGPYLVVINRHLEFLPLPMALFPHLPVLQWIRVPHRFLLLMSLAGAVLAACAFRDGMGRFASRRRDASPWRRQALPVAVCAIVVLEFQPLAPRPLELEDAALYAPLADDDRDFAVLELPLDLRDGLAMSRQIRHGKRLVGGYTSHLMPAALEHLDQPILRALLPSRSGSDVSYLPEFLEVDLDALDEDVVDSWRAQLREDLGVGVIVFHARPPFPPPSDGTPPPGERGLAWKLRAALLPYRINPAVRRIEDWRRFALSQEHIELANRSAQARALVVRLFGAPDRSSGGAEIWDLRDR